MRLCDVLLAGVVVSGAAAAFAAQPAVASAGNEDADALAVLKSADQACGAVRSVAYDVHFEGQGEAQAMAPKITGAVRMRGELQGWPREFRVDLEIERPRSAQVQHIVAGRDQGRFYLVDHGSQTVHYGGNPEIYGSAYQPIFAALTTEFVHPHPFDQEMNGREIRHLGEVEIGGQDCDKVYVEYNIEGSHPTIWCLAKSDALPRRRIDEQPLPNGAKAPLVRTLTNLQVDPVFASDDFTMPTPRGYRSTREPAP